MHKKVTTDLNFIERKRYLKLLERKQHIQQNG